MYAQNKRENKNGKLKKKRISKLIFFLMYIYRFSRFSQREKLS
jgi:hypothetical protein